MEYTFTVLIPAFNAEAFISKALDSVLAQTQAVDEVIVVDDGSSDRTADLVSEWMEAHPAFPLRLIRQANAGVSNARNNGLRAARGAWALLLDADDEFDPDHVERLLHAVRQRSDVVAAFTQGRHFGLSVETTVDERQAKKALDASDGVIDEDLHLLAGRLFESLLPGNYIHPSCLCFRRDAVTGRDCFDESLRVSEDREFLLNLAKAGPFLYVARVTVAIRLHEDNASSARHAIRNHWFASLTLEKVLSRADELRLSDSERARAQYELRRNLGSYFHAASGAGLQSYWNALRQARSRSYAPSLMRVPRHLARALLSDLRRGRA